MDRWRIHHLRETDSTNRDAAQGEPGEVYTAEYQRAGRGRLDHRWLSPPGENLMMSAVLDVAGVAAAEVATLPLVVGLAVAMAVKSKLADQPVALKWPNDILVEGRKLAGILCERHGERVVAGVGVNVGQRDFAAEIAARATSLRLLGSSATVAEMLSAVLTELDIWFARWRSGGFAAVYPSVAALDFLKGREVEVVQTDGDERPISGRSGGIQIDGSLAVAGCAVYAGEAHVSFR